MRLQRTIIICFLSLFCFHLIQAQNTPELRKQKEQNYTTASGVTIKAEQGILVVPENRSAANTASINITFIHLKSTAKNPAAPVIYLEGGPGSSCTWMAENPDALERWLPILEVSDVILFDQRGTGADSKRMIWYNKRMARQPFPLDLLVTEEAANAHFRTMAEQAIPSWQKQGIDLAGYTTIENAKDVEDLRIALNLSKITLFGFSYGTHLGQAYLKYYDQYVDKAILVGVEGLDDTFKQPLSMDEQFYKLSAMVAADPLIGDEIPDLVKLYQSVSQKLAMTPITLTLKSPLTGKDMEVKVGKYGLDFILRCDIGDASDLPIFPRLLYSMSQGDYSVFEWFVQKRITSAYGLHAMAIGMDITSGASAPRWEMINSQAQKSLFGNVVNTPYVELSKVWPVNDLGEEYRSSFTTDVPVLLLSGSLDFNTPPYQAEMLRWRLPNAQHIVVENAGHEQIQNHKQAGLAIIKFLKGKAVNNISAAYPPLQFIPLQGEVSDELWHPALGE